MSTIRCFLSRFGSQMLPAPAVQAYCYFPRFNLGRRVVFMVDTGASGTSLHGVTAWELQRHLRLTTLETARGVGGSCRYYGEAAILVFTDIQGQQITQPLRRIDIQRILPEELSQDADVLRVPHLLGRDILNRWPLIYDVRGGDSRLVVP